ncbi:metal-response element-binding transcription factor 2-like [Amphibalanus amphitrite]|uniref:metal-response element-binding transcription factor 2-like n=1 Tax=Amphibalanus amphitrite TaxID=1232801 RepID=UPI001C90F0D2|nr:metal-response element-binding transcription factor 2-like [Amphibalanus amphitrite]
MSSMSISRKALESTPTSPDSTTVPSKFVDGEEVFSHAKDGRFYLGTVVESDEARARCLVRYADGTQAWSQYRNVSRPRPLDEPCCMCRSAATAADNEIVHCVVCRLPFHQRCVQPKLQLIAPGWSCEECRDSRPKHIASHDNMKLVTNEHKKTLPYSLSSLTWMSDHKVNREQTYCYCGGPGDWFNKMLQCFQCRQWFHEVCIECLQYPLLSGDRYHVFVCAVCNDGTELVKRLDIRWQEVVHLALFNLTVASQKRYHDLDLALLPWIDEHWDVLQAPIYLQTVPIKLRRGEVLRVLQDSKNKSAFQSGREHKKRPGLWSLRVKAPPPPPTVDLRLSRPVTEHSLKAVRVHYSSSRKSKQITPVKLKRKMAEEPKCRSEPVITPGVGVYPPYGAVKKRATTECPGSRYPFMNGRCSHSDAESPPPPPRMLRTRAPPAPPQQPPAPSAAPARTPSTSERTSPGSSEAGAASEPAPPPSVSKRGRKLRPAVKTASASGSVETSSDEASRGGTLDALIPPSFNFDGLNNPFSGLIGTVVTRQLSEKDIRISKTGEVRRRRKRRLRRLPVPPTSAAAGWADVGALFGAAAGGGRGARALLARRTSLSGEVQYLVEWDS